MANEDELEENESSDVDAELIRLLKVNDPARGLQMPPMLHNKIMQHFDEHEARQRTAWFPAWSFRPAFVAGVILLIALPLAYRVLLYSSPRRMAMLHFSIEDSEEQHANPEQVDHSVRIPGHEDKMKAHV